MKRVNENDLPWDEMRSPAGRFHLFGRNFGHALRDLSADEPGSGSAPFEIELVRIPPGATNWPYHSHAAEWECYLIVSGTGMIRHGDDRSAIGAGDCLMCPPGEAHQIVNDGDTDLVYYVVANHAAVDVWRYPDSGKVGYRGPGSPRIYSREHPLPYFEGEE
jgi:uncharacterized cupin superfamily protein